ncbi:MAG: hypothetical protein Q8Q54_10235 [Methylococcales bacterium]|nr:hypothetical protein [Methylococcales bacterium]MDP3839288.1 hypothetical protein [Methylococcales bacterium]
MSETPTLRYRLGGFIPTYETESPNSCLVLSFPRAAWECSNSAPRCTTQHTQSYQQARMELTECGAFRDDATVTRVALNSIRARKLHGIHVIYAVHCCSTRRVETAFPRGAWERVSV